MLPVRLSWIFFLFIILWPGFSGAQSISRVDPPFWWTGMKNPNLQLLVYGSGISEASPLISYEEVKVVEVHRTANPNYLFIDLAISGDAKPGKMEIRFLKEKATVDTFSFELRERSKDSAGRKGFSSSDVIYLLMPDRFANGDTTNDNVEGMLEKADRKNPDGRHGGDIKGILDHLDYLSGLGVTALWMNPLLENNNLAYSYHGYAITDYYRIDPRLGSNADYVSLVSRCHEKGLKVIMDVVLNHASIYGWMVKDLPSSDWIHNFPVFTRSNFRGSTIMDPHASQADRDIFLTGWFDTHMADLDQRNELLSAYLIQNTIWWIEYAGLDGLRLDTQPYSYPDFISLWSGRILEEYPGFNMVGEAWLQQESYTSYFSGASPVTGSYDSGMPTVTDFPLYYAVNAALNEKQGWTEGITRIYNVLAQDFLYGNSVNHLVFLDNHDLNRFYSSIGENLDKFKMGIVLLLTTRGIPVLYYGSEILMTGFEQQGHGQIRKDFPGGWQGDPVNVFSNSGLSEDQEDALAYTKKLLLWRKKKEEVHEGRLLHFIPENEVYAYFRKDAPETIMVIMNNSRSGERKVDLSRFSECLDGFSKAFNVVTGDWESDLKWLTIPPSTAWIFELSR
jgi:glycosidase